MDPGTTQRSPFATVAEVTEIVAMSDVVALLRRVERKEERLMAAQDDINAAAAELTYLVGTVSQAADDLAGAAATLKAQAEAGQATGHVGAE